MIHHVGQTHRLFSTTPRPRLIFPRRLVLASPSTRLALAPPRLRLNLFIFAGGSAMTHRWVQIIIHRLFSSTPRILLVIPRRLVLASPSPSPCPRLTLSFASSLDFAGSVR